MSIKRTMTKADAVAILAALKARGRGGSKDSVRRVSLDAGLDPQTGAKIRDQAIIIAETRRQPSQRIERPALEAFMRELGL